MSFKDFIVRSSQGCRGTAESFVRRAASTPWGRRFSDLTGSAIKEHGVSAASNATKMGNSLNLESRVGTAIGALVVGGFAVIWSELKGLEHRVDANKRDSDQKIDAIGKEMHEIGKEVSKISGQMTLLFQMLQPRITINNPQEGPKGQSVS